MIYIKPRDSVYLDEIIKREMDYNGWLRLSPPVKLAADDFKICIVKIDDIVYTGESSEFWEVYNKAKIWERLQDD